MEQAAECGLVSGMHPTTGRWLLSSWSPFMLSEAIKSCAADKKQQSAASWDEPLRENAIWQLEIHEPGIWIGKSWDFHGSFSAGCVWLPGIEWYWYVLEIYSVALSWALWIPSRIWCSCAVSALSIAWRKLGAHCRNMVHFFWYMTKTIPTRADDLFTVYQLVSAVGSMPIIVEQLLASYLRQSFQMRQPYFWDWLKPPQGPCWMICLVCVRLFVYVCF